MNKEIAEQFVIIMAYLDAIIYGVGPWDGVKYDDIPKPELVRARELRDEYLEGLRDER